MIYLLEDDENIRKFVTYALRQTGFEAVGFGLPSELYAALRENKPELILLDIMLPEEDGISVLKKLKNDVTVSDIPVIMLTAKSSEFDKVTGLDSGADDYITKPFGIMELISRIKAILRRTNKNEEEYTSGDLYLNPKKHIIKVKNEDISLTLKEFEILCALFKNRGTVLTRDRLLEDIWGYDYDGESRTVDVHIKTLRTKLKDSGDIIETVRGIGYKIA